MICDICRRNMVKIENDLWICAVDGLVTSHLKPKLYLYDKSYYEKHQKFLKNEVDEELQNIRVSMVLDYVPDIQRGSLLDFGCGNGSFLLKLDGYFGNKQGFDINPYEDFTRIDYLLQSHDVVTMWDVMEHLESPFSFLKNLNTKYVFITVPCIDDVGVRNLLEWRHYRPYEHIHYYNHDSLKALLESAGYKFLGYNYNESTVRKGGGEKNLISVVGEKI